MSKLRESARGQDCLVRLPGVCNRNPETVVLAHLGGGGMGMKRKNHEGAFCCYNCHQVLDGAANSQFSPNELKLFHLEGVMRTQIEWIKIGLMTIKE